MNDFMKKRRAMPLFGNPNIIVMDTSPIDDVALDQALQAPPPAGPNGSFVATCEHMNVPHMHYIGQDCPFNVDPSLLGGENGVRTQEGQEKGDHPKGKDASNEKEEETT